MSREPHTIESGSKIAIIGGGPAGSFFALHLLHYLRERNIRPEITIYQERDFNESGPKGCKGCAGIISASLLRNIAELDLSLPQEIIQAKIERYAVHSPYASISISNPERGEEIVSVYRGGGPRISNFQRPISFDGWLLKQAQKRGAKVEYQRVLSVSFENRPMVELAGTKLEYDLVVLASGINTKPVRVPGVGYAPPRTRTMASVELYAGITEVQSQLGHTAHAFLIPHSGLVFGTLVPKGPFVHVSLMKTGRHPMGMDDFLNHEIVRKMLPERYERTCACQPRAVVDSARNFYADRFVAVGDAAISRLYKDGIGYALLTARAAAQTVACYGVSRQDFRHHYEPMCQSIVRDNRWGKALFSINDRAKDSPTFLLTQRRLIAGEQDDVRGSQPFTKAAWGMFTGSYSYSSVARMAFNPVSLARLGWSLGAESLRGLFPKKESAYQKQLHVGRRRILILGSGFGGMYTLRHLVRRLNRNENIETTLVSDENFFLFSPLLHEVAFGGIEPRHVAYPVRRLHWRDRFNFVNASVKKIDLSDRRVVTTMGSLSFDFLVLALGGVADRSGLNQVGGNTFTLKTLLDSMLLRNHVIGIFEKASLERNAPRQRQLLTFVVAGAGYVGVQIATQLRDFIFRNLIRFYKTVDSDNIRIILVEADSRVLPTLPAKLGSYVSKMLRHMGIEVRLNSRVTSAYKDHVEINGVELIPTSTLIWVGGAVANPRIAELDVEKGSNSRIVVNQFLEVPAVPGVYALGDCAYFECPGTGEPIPPRAHIAVRQAKTVAHNILAVIRAREKKQYHYSQPGEIVSLGATKAVFRFHGLSLHGFLARLIWVGAYSILITGTYNRIRVIADWLLSLGFGPDITFLKLKK